MWSGTMKFRIAMWAVAGFWAVYAFAAGLEAMISAQRSIWPLARFGCPIMLAGDRFNFGISLYWVLVANAATYAFIGLIVETMRRTVHQTKFSI
jgi:hypothetical protein